MAGDTDLGYPKFHVEEVSQGFFFIILLNEASHKSILNTLVGPPEKWVQRDGGSYLTGPRCYLMTLLTLGLVEASVLLSL